MLFLRLKEPSYGAYSAMLTVLLLWFCSAQGWFQFLFPTTPILHNLTVSLGLLLAAACAEFAKHYLQIKSLSPRLYLVMSVMQWMVVLLFVSKVFFADVFNASVYQVGYGVGLVTSFGIIGSCFFSALLGIKKQLVAAWYYLAGTIVFFVVAILMALSAGNLINLSFSWQFLQLASTIEVLIFSAGLVAMVHRQKQDKAIVEEKLALAQAECIAQLEISNSLKDNIITNAVDPKLFPELAKITKILTDIWYVQADGNSCLVIYKKANRRLKIELDCSLQSLCDSFGDENFTRVHKSYLINAGQPFSLQRRTSADYDLNLFGDLVPVGRKYLSQVKSIQQNSAQ